MEETIKLGIKMREAQKNYFKVRTQEALIASKKLEKEFDESAKKCLEQNNLL